MRWHIDVDIALVNGTANLVMICHFNLSNDRFFQSLVHTSLVFYLSHFQVNADQNNNDNNDNNNNNNKGDNIDMSSQLSSSNE